jgi:hypothetical protein
LIHFISRTHLSKCLRTYILTYIHRMNKQWWREGMETHSHDVGQLIVRSLHFA